jgi:hypothetical protein
MFVTHSAAIAHHHLLLQNRSKHLSIPLYHILILAWSAFVILYGETGLTWEKSSSVGVLLPKKLIMTLTFIRSVQTS